MFNGRGIIITIMRIITLWQPWASFMPWRAKRNETRSWGTDYRGPLAIHAAAKIPREGREACALEPFYSVLCARLRTDWREVYDADMPEKPPVDALIELLPLGEVVGLGELVKITPTSQPEIIPADPDLFGTVEAAVEPLPPLPPEPERSFGIYTPGRKFWQVDKLRPLDKPVPCAGSQGLREIDPILEGLIRQFDPGWDEFAQKAYFRASKDCLCPVCGGDYLHHPMEEEILSYQDAPFLHRLCTGEMVKL